MRVRRSPEDALLLLEAARHRLDEVRPRASRGWRTGAENDQALPPWYIRVTRRVFYAAARCAIRAALAGCQHWREKVRARREAILDTLEWFGLITRTRGDAGARAARLE